MKTLKFRWGLTGKPSKRSLFIKLFLGFLTIIALLSSFNLIAFTVTTTHTREEIVKYNRLLLGNTVRLYEEQFNRTKSLLFNLYYDPKITALQLSLSMDQMNRQNYLNINQISNQIKSSVSNPALFFDNIIIHFKSGYIVDKSGSFDAVSMFTKELTSDNYSLAFWEQQFNERYEYKIMANDSFRLAPDQYQKELIPVLLNISPRRYQIIAMLDARLMSMMFHDMPGTELAILDRDGHVLFQTSDRLAVDRLAISRETPKQFELDDLYYFLETGQETGFTYITTFPIASINAQMQKLTYTFWLLLAVSVVIGLVVSHIFTRRLHRPVKQLVSSIMGDKPLALGSKINEFDLINEQIQHLLHEKQEILHDLVNQKSLLTHYGYIQRLKRIKTNLGDFKEMGAHTTFRLILYQLKYRSQPMPEPAQKPQQMAYAIKEYISLELSGQYPGSNTFQVESNQILSIIFDHEDSRQLEITLNRLKRVLDRDTKYCLVTIAASSVCHRSSQFGTAYEEVQERILCGKLVEETQILLDQHPSAGSQHSAFIADKENDFYMNLQAGNESICLDLMERMLHHLDTRQESALRFRQFSEGVVAKILAIAESAKINRLEQSELHSLMVHLDDCLTVEQLQQFFRQFISAAAGIIRAKKNEANDIASYVIDYLEQHYEQDTSLEQVASQLGMTANYLSTLMKDKTGQTFTDHLHDIRLRHAKQMLSSTNLSVQEIGEKVGYRNVTSFIRLFKKMTSQTPGDFRKSSKMNS
ncbi:Helix-turn-helix domain-containing protein [Paenibacillus sp. UNCCL117]|uniref:helix-turn-helix transcriptional regulator n=1 Tax=unclassified Paenibacillus TaxID=185978 RepID=UPI00088EE3D3|nr:MULTISPECIES: AraC family transcriptional regulator [unclassified Paenibacillus]SDE68423.1 Helix-turn-helix domain-containing protein [Paenibacillus sp. cl123]SFW70860.1 Helix-turn-helix domain-containing protein [Paenibacillus sp. UNCCL117]